MYCASLFLLRRALIVIVLRSLTVFRSLTNLTKLSSVRNIKGMAGVLKRTSNSVRVEITQDVNFANWHEIIVGGSVIFQWKLAPDESSGRWTRCYFIRFSKKKPSDKLNYNVTYTHWGIMRETDTTTMSFQVRTDHAGAVCCPDYNFRGIREVNVEISIDQSSPYATIYDDAELTDFMLRGKDGSVPFHKVVLARHSSVFKTMLAGEWKETSEGVIDVPGTSKEMLQHLKMYMYLGKLPKKQNEQVDCLKQLFLLASCYLIEDLKLRCLKEFRFLLTPENVVEMIQFTMEYNLKHFFVEILDCVAMGDIDPDKNRTLMNVIQNLEYALTCVKLLTYVKLELNEGSFLCALRRELVSHSEATRCHVSQGNSALQRMLSAKLDNEWMWKQQGYIDMTGGVLKRTSNSVRVEITKDDNFANWHEITVGGSVIFQWKLAPDSSSSRWNRCYFIRFSKKNPSDKLNYNVTYTHWGIMEETNTTTMSVQLRTNHVGAVCCPDYSFSDMEKVNVEITIDQSSPYATIYDDAELTDFMLRGKDGSIPFHKVVLAVHSSVFKTMLAGEWKETSEGVIDVPGTSKEMLQNLKMYMYLGKLPKKQNEQVDCLKQLFLLASCYLIEDLKLRCLKEFRFLITPENVIEMIQFTMENNLKQFFVEILDCVAMGDIDPNEVREYIETQEATPLRC